MNLHLEVQRESEETALPDDQDLRAWAQAALRERVRDAELVIRIVDMEEGAALNKRYRDKSGPTNVLSFPFDPPRAVRTVLLGDIVICAPLVRREAEEQKKELYDHWAHLVVHGCLHLLGYDHRKKKQAKKMEAIESRILTGIGVPDPYLGSVE